MARAKAATQAFDAVVIGGGPEGLACGAYLARAGNRVLLLERKHKVGGSLFTDDFSTPFRYNLATTYFLLGDETPVHRDLRLADEGVQFIQPPVQGAFVYDDGKALVLYRDPRRSAKAIGALARPDARRFTRMAQEYRVLWEGVLRRLLYRPPADRAALEAALRGRPGARRFLDLMEETPRGVVEGIGFQDERVEAAFLYLATMFGIDPDAPGAGWTTPLMIHRLQNASLVKGGSMTLAYALANVFVRAGGRILENASVSRILTADGRVKGVELEDGQRFTAKRVVSTLNLQQTFLELLGGQGIPGEVLERVEGWRWEPWSSFTAHFGIKGGPPEYSAAAFNPDVNDALFVVMGIQSPGDIDDRLRAIRAGELPAASGHGTCTTKFDPLQAAPGPEGPLHTLRFECSAPYALKGSTWDEERRRFGGRCEETWRRYAPNLDRALFLFRFVNTPLDVERRWRDMKQGSFHHGALVGSQLGVQRPHPQLSNGRTPIRGLYLGGPSIHPAGLATFGAGYNAAQTILGEGGG